MYRIFFVQIAVLLQILVEILAENKTVTIEALEREKENLFENINTAIDESVRLLNNDKDANAALGVTYMQKLKEQLKDINSDFKDKGVINDTRRSNKLKLNLFDLASIFQKDRTASKIKKNENRILVQKKIDDWLAEREKEKRKIQQYKEKRKLNVKVENCPR